MYRDRSAFAANVGSNMYVPKMQYSGALVHGRTTVFSLGSPAAVDNDIIDTDIDADATVGTETTQSNYSLDGTYGRTLTMNANADPGAGGIVDVYGLDYLNQPMVERFTFVSGSTAVLYGKKAFKTVQKTKIVGAAANATTYDLGTGWRLGLPFKGDLQWAKENGVYVPIYKRDEIIWIDRAAAKAVAGGTDFVYIPFPGFVKTLYGVPAGGGGATDPVITVELGGVAITGLTVTIDTSDVTGLTVSDTPTTAGYSANNRLRTGDKVEIVAAAAAGAFADRIGLEITPTQFSHPVVTDPQTTTTGDPRGTYEPLLTPDGSEIIVGLVGDPAFNASGNGGLHGIRHVVA